MAAAAARRLATAAAAPLPLFGSLFDVLTPDVGARLARDGVAVVDGALTRDGAATVRAELAALKSLNLLTLNATHLVHAGTRELLPKAGVWEAEPAPGSAAAAAAPALAAAAADSTLAVLLSVVCPSLDLRGASILKAQLNEGHGACFPIHLDTDEAVDARSVTAIFYADAEERPRGDGALRLWSRLAGPPLDVRPAPGRAVLFSAARVPHRVLPSSSPRHCFSVWLSSGRRRPPPAGVGEVVAALARKGAGPAAARAALLVEPDGRRALARVRLGREWDESLVASHPASAALNAARAARAADEATLRAAFASVGVDPDEEGLGDADGDPVARWFW